MSKAAQLAFAKACMAELLEAQSHLKSLGVMFYSGDIEFEFMLQLDAARESIDRAIDAAMGKNGEAKSCIYCGEGFFVGPVTKKQSSARYCSEKCRFAANYRRRKPTKQAAE